MKYICMLTTNGEGGIWSVVRETLSLLSVKYETKIIIYTRNGDLKYNVISLLEKLRIPYLIININVKNGWIYDLCRLLYYRKIHRFIGISNEKILIHSHDSFSAGFSFLGLKGIKYKLYTTFHGIGMDYTSSQNKIKKLFSTYIRLPLLRYSKANIISCDPNSIPTLENIIWGDKKKTFKIDLAINGVRKYTSQKKDNSYFGIGFISRLHPLKGWSIVAEASKVLYNKGINIKVFFSGAGHDINEVKNWCEINAEFASYLGHIFDIEKEVFPFIDVHVLPTKYPEGLPMIILETMSAGIPTISTNAGSINCAIKDKYNGLMVEPDIISVINALELLINNKSLYNELSNNCILNWNEKFSSKAMVEKYESIWNNQN